MGVLGMIHFKFILLEWESDEVYGDYLIEDNEETTKISYFRFYHKFKTFSLPKKSYSERERHG